MNNILNLTAMLAGLGVSVFFLGIVVSPDLPPPSAPAKVLAREPPPLNILRFSSEFPLSPSRNRQLPEQAGKALRFAFLSHNDPGSFSSLKRSAERLDAVVPDWLQLDTAAGMWELEKSPNITPVASWLRAKAPNVEIHPQFTSQLSPTETLSILARPETRDPLVQQISEYLSTNRFQGIVVNFVSLPPSSHRILAVFLRDLSAMLHRDGRGVILMTSPHENGRRLHELSRFVDYVLVNTFEQNQNEMRPGSCNIAGQGWFEAQVSSVGLSVPPDKLILGIGAFGYDVGQFGTKRGISVQQAWDILKRTGVELGFDQQTLTPNFSYLDEEGNRREVCFLDGVTAFNQMKAALAIEPFGVAIWRLGLEDPGVWISAGRGRVPDEAALAALEIIEPGPGAWSQVRGVLLSAKPGLRGARTVIFNENTGLIVDETMSVIPFQSEITAWQPTDPKAVALTFDDGPDPKYTAKILDILAEKDVKATFYVTGQNALGYPDLMNRIVREGHDFGNHSFSHPDFSTSSSERIAGELNATQRVFESQLGMHSVLFRPPYVYAGYIYLETSPAVIETASRLGYLFGGLDVESYDYFGQPTLIVERVVREITQNQGQVVLLHDSGGNRQPTIDALVPIIDAVRAVGHRFTTTHELVGLLRHEVMPALPKSDLVSLAEAKIRLNAVRTAHWLIEAFPALAIAATLVVALRFLLIVVGAIVQKRKGRAAPAKQPFDGTIAVLVPAYNEERIICKTVHSLLASSIGNRLDIIVIDDGSADDTSKVIRINFDGDDRVKLLRKENGGKSAALNFGLKETSADVIIAIDGDTILLSDALERLVRPFNDPAIGAVAGKVVVGNQANLLTRFQALEYITSQNLDRRAFELFNAIGVVPGAIGAWRRKAVIEAGGYSHDTLAEDADLTLTLQRVGWKVVAAPDAQALTEAPETLTSFTKQRFRWMFGTLQVAFKHRGSLLERPTGVSLITIPNILLFQFAFTLLAPVMDLFLVVLLGHLAVSSWLQINILQVETLVLLGQYWLLFQTVDVLAAAIGVGLDPKQTGWRLIPLLLLQRFTYRQLLYWVAVRVILAALKGTFVGWGKLIRTGNVTAPMLSAHPIKRGIHGDRN